MNSPAILECFRLQPDPPHLVPGAAPRGWMDEFAARHPYRCHPLTLANTSGWDLLCPVGFEVEWDGQKEASALRIQLDDGADNHRHFVTSHFTEGVLTFHTGWLFRTPPGWGLRVSGSPNHFKHGIQALEGLVQTEWLPYPFTMNWRFTAPGVVRFEKHEPFGFIQPVAHMQASEFMPESRELGRDSDLAAQYQRWLEVRQEFNLRMQMAEPAAVRKAWQGFYFRGEFPDPVSGKPAAHVQKRRLHPLRTVINEVSILEPSAFLKGTNIPRSK